MNKQCKWKLFLFLTNVSELFREWTIRLSLLLVDPFISCLLNLCFML